MAVFSELVTPPALTLSGLFISNNPTTPNTKINIWPGIARDFYNRVLINLGNFLGEGTPTVSPNSTTVIDATKNGINGLDQGTLQPNTVYAVSAIGDSSGRNPAAAICCKEVNDPVMPYGYDCVAALGVMITDASAHFLPCYYLGVYERTFFYASPQPTSVINGNATTYTSIDLSSLIWLALSGANIYVRIEYTPASAGNSVYLQPNGSSSDMIVIPGPVAGQKIVNYVWMPSTQDVPGFGVPKINYKVTNGSDSVSIYIAGFKSITF